MMTGVRELTREAVRTRLAEAAYNHFVAHGFDASTVEEAANAAGISRATFFRYFRSKEDAVIAAMQSSHADFETPLRALDDRPGESAWALVRRAFDDSVDATESAPDRVRAKTLMITSTPSLRAHLAERRAAQEDRLAIALAERVDPLTAKVLAATALAAFDLAWREWASTPDASFRGLLDDVFARLADSVA